MKLKKPIKSIINDQGETRDFKNASRRSALLYGSRNFRRISVPCSNRIKP